MNFSEIKNVFEQFDSHLKDIRAISINQDAPLCDLENIAYCYDDIVNSRFENDKVPKSFDAISFKDNCINFIEFKDAKITSKVRADVRMKVAEGLHCLERVILNSFLIECDVRSRFVLVYSKEKNKNQTPIQHKLNDGLMAFSTLPKLKQRFIGDKYDKQWKYVDEAISLDEIEFSSQINNYI